MSDQHILKPYFVELRINAVVMAASEAHAMVRAESLASNILSDGELGAESAELVESLKELASLDPEWEGGCLPYGGDGQMTLAEMLPEETPVKDTFTIDMFAPA